MLFLLDPSLIIVYPCQLKKTGFFTPSLSSSRSSKYWYYQGLGILTAIMGVGGQSLEVVSNGTVTGLVFSL